MAKAQSNMSWLGSALLAGTYGRLPRRPCSQATGLTRIDGTAASKELSLGHLGGRWSGSSGIMRAARVAHAGWPGTSGSVTRYAWHMPMENFSVPCHLLYEDTTEGPGDRSPDEQGFNRE